MKYLVDTDWVIDHLQGAFPENKESNNHLRLTEPKRIY